MRQPHKHFAIHNLNTNEYLTNQGTWHATLFRTDSTLVGTRFWKNIDAICKYAILLYNDDLEIVDGNNAVIVSNIVLTSKKQVYIDTHKEETLP